MANFRSYLAAQASLIRNNGTNASRNPIIELSWGGSADSVEATKVTRFVFRPDFTALREEVAAGRLRRGDVGKHELFFKNVVALAPELLQGEVEDARRGSGVSVYLRKLPATEVFEEGKGMDYLYYPGYNLNQRAPQQAANWSYRRNGDTWATPGAWDPATGTALGECRVSEGTEDLRYNVTAYVQGVLFDAQPECPLMLQLDETAENLLDVRRYVVTFFSRHTHHWFEPYLETVSDPGLYEHRCEVPLDEPARLFLQIPANLNATISVLGVTLYNAGMQSVGVFGPDDVQRSRPGLYYVDISLNSELCGDGEVFVDEWQLEQNGSQKKIEQHFTAVDRLLAPLTDDFDRTYGLSVAGLRHNEVISRSLSAKPRRVVVNHRVIERGQIKAGGCPPSDVQYRVYCPQGKEQINVIPYTPCYEVNQALFFELDARWLIPQYYTLEVIPLTSDGHQQGSPLVTRFRVVN